MDTQPGQVLSPQNDDQKPGASQQPGTAGYVGPQNTPAGQPASEPTLPPIAASQQPAPEDAQSFYNPGDDDMAETQTGGWQYSQEANPSMPQLSPTEDLTWTASEFIEHPKGIGWYSVLGLVGLVVAGLNFLITRDIVSTVLLALAVVIFGIYAGHKPRTREYHLTPKGLQIGEKLYVFQMFKAFSVGEEGSTASIVFTPLGRFGAPITIYVQQDLEDKVLNYISNFLPFEQHRTDAIDGLLRKIRF